MSNYSKQREVILESIKENRIHPTAEEIYQLVIQKEPKISKSTVYRNINVLLEQGSIRKITMTTGADRFEYAHKEHQHIICENCGRVMDFCYNFDIPQIEKKITSQLKNTFEINNVILYGICEDCKSKIKNKEELENGIKRK